MRTFLLAAALALLLAVPAEACHRKGGGGCSGGGCGGGGNVAYGGYGFQPAYGAPAYGWAPAPPQYAQPAFQQVPPIGQQPQAQGAETLAPPGFAVVSSTRSPDGTMTLILRKQ